MNIEEKLINLEKSTLDYAQKKCDKIREEYEEKKSRMISQKEFEILGEYYTMLQKKKAELIKEKNNKIMQASTKNKQNFLIAREKMTDNIFALSEKKVRDFTDMELYKNYMENILNEAKYVFPNEKVEVTINKNDKRFEELLKSRDDIVASFTFSPDDIIGGMILTGIQSRKIYDHSLKNALVYERKNFLKNINFNI